MSLKDCKIKSEYVSLKDNVPRDFYIPLLKEATLYKRAVGYFSSTALIELSKGICSLVKNGGKIQVIASPDLSDEDVNAIKEGYESRKIIEQRLLQKMGEHKDYESMERLNLLASLIADDKLDIKIACTKTFGIYHQKIGIIFDGQGNKVAFSGSANETLAAMVENYESFDVFKSWENEEQFQRVESKCKIFDSIWSNNEDTLIVMDFPNVKTEFIKKYRNSHSVRLDLDENAEKVNIPSVPSEITFHDYQKEAIENWASQNYCGIFDMATGTGKTLTGLGALVRLSKSCNVDFCTVILCPYIHLVTQWISDIEKFNIKPIIAFGNSPQKDWKKKFERAIERRNWNKGSNGFFCIISTVRTFCGKFVQEKISKVKKPILLIADEAHNVGAQGAKKYLDEKYKYRLALSATIERHFDNEGTEFLYNFFGKICISYDLKRAIEENYLCKYKYHPVTVFLNQDEREKYYDLSKSISKEIISDVKTGKKELTEKGKRLCIIRSKIIAGAEAKIDALLEAIEPYKNDNKILIYCGTASYFEDFIDDEDDCDSIRQIDLILKRVYDKHKMKIAKFVAEKKSNERSEIIRNFSDGENLQAITAIKCLDEGVNIPSIKTAFILASTTNPKEYIQRRGRVLRKAHGKEFAEIYDFICLPYDFENMKNLSTSELSKFGTLLKNETSRLNEFYSLCENKEESISLKFNLEKMLGMLEQDSVQGENGV